MRRSNLTPAWQLVQIRKEIASPLAFPPPLGGGGALSDAARHDALGEFLSDRMTAPVMDYAQ